MIEEIRNPQVAPTDFWDLVQEKLQKKGISLEEVLGEEEEIEPSQVKVVYIPPDLSESVQEMGQIPRDQTVMVRIDEETSKTLDAWVDTGYFRSRSEATAMFLREGLKVRNSELEKLQGQLIRVEEAKKRLHDEALKIFGQKK